METINDVLNFLSKLEFDVFTTMGGNEDSLRVKQILPNLFQDGNCVKLKSMWGNLEEIDILYRAGDWHERPGVVRILGKDIKILQLQMYD